MFRSGSLAGALLLVALGLPAIADETRVYTNADLERLPPLPTSAPSPAVEGPGWEFVIDFLAEQHARIDARRAYELDSVFVEETARRSAEASRPRYALPYSYWSCYTGSACTPHRPAPSTGRPALVPRPWPVPLHARRPLAHR